MTRDPGPRARGGACMPFQRIVLLVVVALASLCAPARADLIPPGYKRVSHTLVVEPSPLLAAHDLVAYPVRGFGTAVRVVPGQPFDFSSKYGTKLYAVPRDRALPAHPEVVRREWFEGFASCSVPVVHVGSVPVASPTLSIETRLVLEQLDPDTLRFSVVGETVERDPATLAVMAAAVVLGTLGLAWFARRRRRAQVERGA